LSVSEPAVIASLGAGRMGRGIAHAFAYAGHPVLLVDVRQRPAAEARKLGAEALAEIDASLRALAALGAFDDAARGGILERIRFVSRDEAAGVLGAARFVFEGVPEVLETKRACFEFACPLLAPGAILASTTSTFLSSLLAESVAERRNFLNAHWLNPAYLVPLVELSPHPGTGAAALAQMKAVLEAIGKVPVVCAAAPGFIVPRLQSLLMNEAARMIEQGVASAEDIDKATRHGLGFRYASMGVVEFIDYGGNDILYFASRYLAEALGDARYAAPEIVDRYMKEGRNGLRSGRGFYDWGGLDAERYRRDALGRLLAMLRHQGKLLPPGAALSGAASAPEIQS
jgi:3-hydroxybutyryl-CoA dehydrogenase